MIFSTRLAKQIHCSGEFKKLIWANYLKHSNGLTMREYATEEKKLLFMGTYGVEEFYNNVKDYLGFLDLLLEKF